jgi:DNA topoisomerase III
LLPPLRNGETAQLHDPKIEDKETRPPPRYNEGTLIEAMQNAWRFVDDEVLRERLKEAKGIGTPATRAEIIGGLKKQSFLIAQGKHIVPTEAGLSLFGVLKQADPALVDPGVTAQLERLLDNVVVGKQEMVGAIDAVCSVAERIIGKLKEGAVDGGPPLLDAAIGIGPGTFPPTPAISAAQMLYAKKIAQGKGVVIPEEAKANSAAISAWIDSNRSAQRRKRGRKTANKPAGSIAPQPTVPTKRPRKRKADATPTPAQPNSVAGTPLRIPYGNKEVALKLGARYRSGGWYAPPGVDLAAFSERGWL